VQLEILRSTVILLNQVSIASVVLAAIGIDCRENKDLLGLSLSLSEAEVN